MSLFVTDSYFHHYCYFFSISCTDISLFNVMDSLQLDYPAAIRISFTSSGATHPPHECCNFWDNQYFTVFLFIRSRLISGTQPPDNVLTFISNLTDSFPFILGETQLFFAFYIKMHFEILF